MKGLTMKNSNGKLQEGPVAVHDARPIEHLLQPAEISQAAFDVTVAAAPVDLGETFDRVAESYDLPLMQRSRIVNIGVGGAGQFLETLARCGIEEFVLVDFDTVALTNVATQHFNRNDVGRLKVAVVRDKILSINPNARVLALPLSLDALDDDVMDLLLHESLPNVGAFEAACADCLRWLLRNRRPSGGESPARTVLLGCTDSFFAQARVNRLGLQFGVPTLMAQVWPQAVCTEVTVSHPDVTRACHRCMLQSRYRAFLAEGARPPQAVGSSQASSIWTTERLNALKGMLVMALLHHGTNHRRWGRWLERIGNRTLILTRVDPDLAQKMGFSLFDDVLAGADGNRMFADETIWLAQEPEDGSGGRPRCPECGGTGDLREAIGTFADTRTMPPIEENHNENS